MNFDIIEYRRKRRSGPKLPTRIGSVDMSQEDYWILNGGTNDKDMRFETEVDVLAEIWHAYESEPPFNEFSLFEEEGLTSIGEVSIKQTTDGVSLALVHGKRTLVLLIPKDVRQIMDILRLNKRRN